MYKLIVKQAPAWVRDEPQENLITRLNAKQFRYKWNIRATGLERMEAELTDEHYIVYIILPSEEDAALFKLTYM
jgi:hypothetical protein